MKLSPLLLSIALFFYANFSFAQSEVKGKIEDKSSGSPLIGASIRIEDTFIFTQSDLQGNFVIENLKEGKHSLLINFIGFQEQRIPLTIPNANTLTISLEPSIVMSDEVVVISTRASNSLPATHTNLNFSELESRNHGQDIPHLLSLSPSVVVSSDAGNGVGYTGLRIRGSDPDRINITINGIPVNDPESQGTFWVDFPDLISSTDNLQIQRGLGTSTNGGGAFGGSVNIKTSGLQSKPHAEINNSFGSFNTVKNTISAGTGLLENNFSFDGRLSRIASDGYMDRARSDLKSYYVSGGYFGKKTVVKMIAFSGLEKTYQAWNGVSQDSLKTNRTFNSAGLFFDKNGNANYYKNENDHYTQSNYQLHFSKQLRKQNNINLGVHYTKGKGYYEQFKEDQALLAYGLDEPMIGFIPITESDLVRQLWLDNDFYGAIASYNFKSLSGVSGTLGAAYHIYEGKHFGKVVWAEFAGNSLPEHEYYFNDAVKKELNFYEKFGYQFSNKTNAFIDLQWRNVDYTFNGFDANLIASDQSVNHQFFNPKGGINYEFAQGKIMYGYFGIGNKEPNRNDYINSSASSRPKPESMQNLEFGYSHASKAYEFGLNFYWMNYKDQLVLTGEINDVGAYNRTNVSKSYRQGIELMGKINLSKTIYWSPNITYSQNKIKRFNEFLDDYDNGGQIAISHTNTDISFSPSIIAGSNLSVLPFKRFSISLLTKYVGEQFLDNTSNTARKLDAYLINDVLISWNVKLKPFKEISFSFLVSNVLEEMYESNGYTYAYLYGSERIDNNFYYPQAGRSFTGGVSIKF